MIFLPRMSGMNTDFLPQRHGDHEILLLLIRELIYEDIQHKICGIFTPLPSPLTKGGNLKVSP